MRTLAIAMLFLCVILSVVLLVLGYRDIEEDTEQTTAIISRTIPAVEVPLSAFPVPSGHSVGAKEGAVIDYSNVEDGYIMVRYSAPTDRALRVMITPPGSNEYTYHLNNDNEFETFPLTEGSGEYRITVLRQYVGRLYSEVYELTLNVDLADEHAPFLRSNKFVNFEPDSLFIDTAVNLGVYDNDYETIEAIHDFIVDNMTYDRTYEGFAVAGYVPCLNRTYTELTGACFDYAAFMVAILRVHEIPSRLVFGYFLDEYHAWVEAYTETSGWIRKDPSTISSGNWSRIDLMYVSNDLNYIPMYYY